MDLPNRRAVVSQMESHSSSRIVLVSDDEPLRALICGLLAAHGFGGVAGVGSKSVLASRRLLAGWDVAIVDASVSHADALRVFRELKRTAAAIVAIFAQGNPAAALHEVASAGHVLLRKPFDPRELLLVIRGILDGKRDAALQSSSTVSVGPITLSRLVNAANVAAREIALTDVETRILHELLRNANTPVTRERLMRRGLLRDWAPDDRCLDTHINRLRRKLGNDRHGRTPIRTVRGVGYLLLAEWEPMADDRPQG